MVKNISLNYGDGSTTKSISSNKSRRVIFTLFANRHYSTSFDIYLEWGRMENVSSDYFSKVYTVIFVF